MVIGGGISFRRYRGDTTCCYDGAGAGRFALPSRMRLSEKNAQPERNVDECPIAE